MVTAVARAGRRVDRLVEHLSAEVDYRGVLVGGTDDRWCLPVDGQDLVVLLALEATRPAG